MINVAPLPILYSACMPMANLEDVKRRIIVVQNDRFMGGF